MSDPISEPVADAARKNLPTQARQLIATARNDITIPMFTTVLQPLDATLIARGGGKGLALYDEVDRDTHAYAVLQKRKLALVAREWVVEPASDAPADEEAADFIRGILQKLNFDRLCLDLLDATLKGYAVAEIVWMREGAVLRPEQIVAHDPRRFVFDEDWRPRLLTMAQPSLGEELPDRKFIAHRFGVRGNNPYGIGLGSRLFWPVLFKREGVQFWLTFLEKFASPTPVGKYPLGTLPEQQQALLNGLIAMAQQGAIVAPIGSEISFLEASRAGRASYEEWCRYWDTQMALCVFGSTLATHVEGQGSRAAAETHKEAEEQIIDADGDLLADTLSTTLISWLIDYNRPGAGIPRVRRIRPKNEMQHELLRKERASNMAAELALLFDLSVRVPSEKFAEIAAALADIDLMPQVPIEVLRMLAPHLAAVRDRLEEAARAGRLKIPETEADKAAVRQIAFAADDEIAPLVDQVEALAQPEIDRMIAAAFEELSAAERGGESATEAGDRLLRLFADNGVSIDPLGRILGGALTVAEASGRATVRARDKGRRK